MPPPGSTPGNEAFSGPLLSYGGLELTSHAWKPFSFHLSEKKKKLSFPSFLSNTRHGTGPMCYEDYIIIYKHVYMFIIYEYL